jgi:hypothetical protein
MRPYMRAHACSRCCQYSFSVRERRTRFRLDSDNDDNDAFPYFVQVKTRMQLERGKTSVGLLGSFRSIIREEGCVSLLRPTTIPLRAELPILIASDDSTAVCRDPFSALYNPTKLVVNKVSYPHYCSKHPNAPRNCACFFHHFARFLN